MRPSAGVSPYVPSDDNPKTGKLVAMALVKAVRQFAASTIVGA